MTDIPGYTYAEVEPSPVTTAELDDLHASLLWGEQDATALARAAGILVPQTDAILDVWYGFVGVNPHLVATFAGADGSLDGAYLAAVRARFGKWIEDLCTRPHDEIWLGYQEEIARRHHPVGKNLTDGVASTSGHVPLGHLIALIVPITVTIRPFLTAGDATAEEVDAMHQAWMKAVTLSVALWARPYTPELW